MFHCWQVHTNIRTFVSLNNANLCVPVQTYCMYVCTLVTWMCVDASSCVWANKLTNQPAHKLQ